LCSKCSQNYISGLIDPGSENKKVARYIATPMNSSQTKIKAPIQQVKILTKPSNVKPSKESSKKIKDIISVDEVKVKEEIK